MVDADLGQAGLTSNLELHSAGSWVQQVEAFEPLQAAMAISRSTSSAFVALHPVGSRRELPPYLFDYLGQLLVPFKGQFDATIIDVGPISPRGWECPSWSCSKEEPTPRSTCGEARRR
jgi:hypothetical protein